MGSVARPEVRPQTTSTGGTAGSASTRRRISIPSSVGIGVMPSRINALTTPSFSPIPVPDQTDHSSAIALACGCSRPKRKVSSVIQSFAVA